MDLIKDIYEKDYKQFFVNYKPQKKSFLRSLLFSIIAFAKAPFIFLIIFLAVFFSVVAAPLQNSKNSSAQSLVSLDPEKQKVKEELENELQKVLQQIENYKKTIAGIVREKKSIKNDISLTEANIQKISLEIKAINLSIQKLKAKINDTQKSIALTENKISRSQEILASSLRSYYKLKQRNIIEVFLAEIQVSDYFNNFFYLQKLQEQINDELRGLKDLNIKLSNQKASLEEQFGEQNGLLSLSKIKYGELQELKNKKQALLVQANKKETQYNALLRQAEKTAAEIREQIYRLAGGVGPITFGQAYDLAKIAEKHTGVRPAFLLAILHYESKIGQNVGNCNYKDAMKPSEQPLFEKIVKELGLDPNKMVVSCKPWYGWGGAMGPAQFIPSTWMAYKDKVATITGNNPPSPWNNLDAFIAAALLLANNGADARTYKSEWKAAMIYFAGSNWNKPSLSFYGDDVMAIAARFENDIQILEKNN